MMSAVIYLKRYQYRGIHHYAKVWHDRDPPLSEVVNFLNPVPQIEHREYDLTVASDLLAYETLLETWDWVLEDEFTHAYQEATAGEFRIYINGKAL
ncbi:hypothetical protein [Spirosoma flavum]|uniref:Uncharacterized protein n=1 Tax=Spirosoma flavum TaxID=2048557 RepID=A0ABW6AV72_9BACT